MAGRSAPASRHCGRGPTTPSAARAVLAGVTRMIGRRLRHHYDRAVGVGEQGVRDTAERSREAAHEFLAGGAAVSLKLGERLDAQDPRWERREDVGHDQTSVRTGSARSVRERDLRAERAVDSDEDASRIGVGRGHLWSVVRRLPGPRHGGIPGPCRGRIAGGERPLTHLVDSRPCIRDLWFGRRDVCRAFVAHGGLSLVQGEACGTTWVGPTTPALPALPVPERSTCRSPRHRPPRRLATPYSLSSCSDRGRRGSASPWVSGCITAPSRPHGGHTATSLA
jgi:hypothetical protein